MANDRHDGIVHTAAIGLTASITSFITSTAQLHVSIVLIASSARRRAADDISIWVFGDSDNVIVKTVADSARFLACPSTPFKIRSISICRMLSSTYNYRKKKTNHVGVHR
jgi:hypothetical protein